MSEDEPQVIEKSIEINAPIDRVWKLMTTPSEMPRWWSPMKSAEMDLVPGGAVRLRWDMESHKETLARIIEVEEPRFFSWFWAANSEGREPSPGDQTRVEFRLEELGESTRVTVNESGFESLESPPEQRMTTFEGNTRGWTSVMEQLAGVFD